MQSEVSVRMLALPIGLLLISGLIVGAILAIRNGYGKTLLGTAVVSGLLMLFVIGFFATPVRVEQHQVAVSQGSASQFDPVPPTPPAAPIPGPEQPVSGFNNASRATPPTGPAPQKIQVISGQSAPVEMAELPGWRKNPVNAGSLESGSAKYVMSSKQYATIEEAEAELLPALISDVQRGFAFHQPETAGWTPTREDIASSGLIVEKVIETSLLKVGEFENPVYRVSWLVEFRPDSIGALHARWAPVESERRSRLLLTILAGISGSLGVSALWLRRRREETPSPNQVA